MVFDCHTGDTHLLEREVLSVLNLLEGHPKSSREILDILDSELTALIPENVEGKLPFLEGMLYTLRDTGLVTAVG